MAEAPGSRTQPPRVGGGRPVLKTGRATGPRSLPGQRDHHRTRDRHLPVTAGRKARSAVERAGEESEPGVREQPDRDDASLERCECRRCRSGPRMAHRPPRAGRGRRDGALVLDQANFTGAWTLGRLFDGEIYPLALPQQLEHRTTNRTAMEKMFDSSFVPDEAEPFVDQETRDRTACHTYSSDTRTPLPQSRRKDAPRIGPGPDDHFSPLRLVVDQGDRQNLPHSLTGAGCATGAPSATDNHR